MTTTKNGTIEQVLDALQLDIELTEQQRRAFDVLDWLHGFDKGSMKSGRTTLLAIHAIKGAMDHPGTRISYADHYRSPSGQTRMGLVIEGFLDKMKPELRSYFSISRHSLTFGQRDHPPRVDITYRVVKESEVAPKLHLDFSGVRTGRLRCDRPNESNRPKSSTED